MVTLLLAVFLLSFPLLAQVHPELIVAADGDGRLVMLYDAERPYPLPASRFPGISGYADAMPGMSSLFEPRLEEGLFALVPTASIEFVLVGADAGLAVWNDTGSRLMQPGEAFRLGAPFFDSHPMWNLIESEAGKSYGLSLKVRDTSGRYRESKVATPRFAPDDSAALYMCPMSCSGGATFAQQGTCAVCGMRLKLLSARRFQVDVTGSPVAGEPATLGFAIRTPGGGPVADLEVVHEKLIHLLIVSDDLAWFAHEHPELQPDGSFALTLTFPHGGGFTLFHDFTPASAGMQVVPVELEVKGEGRERVPLVVDATTPRAFDGYTVALRAPQPAKSLVDQALTVTLEKDGQPVTDLQPFLGAMGHLIVIREDREHFVHSHPLPAASTGPEVIFSALFPAPGRYKAWAQMQHQGRVLTAPFVFDVVAPR